MKKFNYKLWLLLSTILVSCQYEQKQAYSFFVAGHVYGQPGIDNIGVYPPFQSKLDSLKSDTSLRFGIFTGDIVIGGSAENWAEIDTVMKRFALPLYFAVGNHDMTNPTLFKEKYGATFYHFSFQNDLFIILNPNLNHWNISGEQLAFLKQSLAEKADESRHIFVFFHQLLWVDSNNKYKNIKPNSMQDRADTINFWSEVEPLFHALDKPVYMFAGDVGATDFSDNIFYDCYDNIHLIASGMGNRKADNFLLVRVVEQEKVWIEVCPINNYKVGGNIEKYLLKE